MRHSRLSRFLTAMFGIWFTFTLVQPNGMIGMSMSGDSASMNMAMSASMAGMNMESMKMESMDMSGMSTNSTDASSAEHVAASSSKAEQGTPAQSSAPEECDQHDCCCSAVSPTLLTPEATLAWLPEHVINQETPQSGDCVVHTDGQLLLPFANGPPQTVSA